MSLFDSGDGASAIALADLLDIEDCPELLAPRCPVTAIPVWPIIRVAFLRRMMADLLFSSGSIEPPVQPLSLQSGAVLARAAAHNARLVATGGLRSQLLINTEAIGDELHDGRWYNRYVDPFGDLPSGQAVMLTDMFEWQWRSPRHNERVFHNAPIQIGAMIAGRLAGRGDAAIAAQAAVALACDRAKALLGWSMGEEQRAAFAIWAIRKVAALPFRYRAYRRLLRRVRPRLLLGSSGCYGIHAPLIAAARDMDIVTAEYQHGAISAGHDAYNFAPAIFASDAYRRTLPQYLLTYGNWWSAQATAPVERVAIGYPARSTKVERLGAAPERRSDILVLSDGIEFDLYLDLARTIARDLKDSASAVVIRPHPMERSDVRRRFGDKIDDIRIDAAPDIYASFRHARTVVSEMSTGLFEAIGLVERIILLDTAKARFAFPDHPFETAASVEDLLALLNAGVASTPDIIASDFWATQWQVRYRSFLTEKAQIDA